MRYQIVSAQFAIHCGEPVAAQAIRLGNSVVKINEKVTGSTTYFCVSAASLLS
jgi:hypothetical protein